MVGGLVCFQVEQKVQRAVREEESTNNQEGKGREGNGGEEIKHKAEG